MGHGGHTGPWQCPDEEHHGGMDGGPARCGGPLPCPDCAQCVEGRERRGQRRAGLQDELYHPHISAMASPFPPHAFWQFSLGHAEVLLCFFALPSLLGPIFLPAFLLRWWQ